MSASPYTDRLSGLRQVLYFGSPKQDYRGENFLELFGEMHIAQRGDVLISGGSDDLTRDTLYAIGKAGGEYEKLHVVRGNKEIYIFPPINKGACLMYPAVIVTRDDPVEGDDGLGKVVDVRYQAFVVQISEESAKSVGPTKLSYADIRKKLLMWFTDHQQNSYASMKNPFAKGIFGKNGIKDILMEALRDATYKKFDERFGGPI